jgi:hypothetical protein
MTEKEAQPAGIMASIVAGFDLVTRHLWLVLIPLLLDVFYWIGPQLRSQRVILDLAAFLQQTGGINEVSEQLSAIAGRTNLLSLVSVPYLGVPGLMAGFIMPETTPFVAAVLQIESGTEWALWLLATLVLGLLIATVFYGLLAAVVRDGRVVWSAFVGRMPLSWLRYFLLAAVLVLVVLAVYLPLLVVGTVAALFSPVLASLVMIVGLALIIWIIFYLGFGIHGILMREMRVVPALLLSARFVQQYWLQALSLFLIIIVIRNLLAWLWLGVDTGSWLTLVSIAGYDFINTALLAATFIFYRERTIVRA